MLMWAVIRDEQLYEAHRTKAKALAAAKTYRSGSKHKWRITRIAVKGWDE